MALVEFVSLVAAVLPDCVEVFPEYVDEFGGPGFAILFFRVSQISMVLFLVVDHFVGDAATKEVLPSDGLLHERYLVHCVCLREAELYVWVAEPLDEAAGAEFADGLCSVAVAVEGVEGGS